MTASARSFASFEAAFAKAFEEEISGETFFAALAETEPAPRRAALWHKLAVIENRTDAALRGFATEFGVSPADETAVQLSGRAEAADWQALPFLEVMAIMDRDYPAYVVEFTNLLDRAPEAAKPAAQLLIDHEIAIIAMARAELSGKEDPAAPLDAYLARLAGAADGL
ncbi:hypothetical protein L0V05_11480 [Tabrizicola sp. J26]|uniref:hypothetical protein n=1 Tax=Alitabrizicola rongguiensis TaxID=2909234 RepID=UPI001F353EC9|nr:hypothetical protein [Tabrizicola rongguiensis]MCF1709439.1 hypothetical protein [Tabrizicola rongguiensis]